MGESTRDPRALCLCLLFVGACTTISEMKASITHTRRHSSWERKTESLVCGLRYKVGTKPSLFVRSCESNKNYNVGRVQFFFSHSLSVSLSWRSSASFLFFLLCLIGNPLSYFFFSLWPMNSSLVLMKTGGNLSHCLLMSRMSVLYRVLVVSAICFYFNDECRLHFANSLFYISFFSLCFSLFYLTKAD